MIEIRKTKYKCFYFKNSFCYVCGNFVENDEKRVKISERIKMIFRYCFSSDIVQEDGFRPGKILVLTWSQVDFSLHSTRVSTRVSTRRSLNR